MRSRIRGAAMTLALAAATTSTPTARAQGSAVMTHGSCAVALASAGVADPCRDGSAVLFSPAAITRESGVVGVGLSGITTSGSFAYDYTGGRVDRDERTTQVPFGFASARVRDRLAVGLGVFAPYGLRIVWPESFEGRFVSYDTNLRNVYVQPTLAYQLTDRISVGAGLDVVLGSIRLDQRVDLAAVATGQANPVTGAPIRFRDLGVPSGTDFADARLAGDGTGYSFHLGAQADLADYLSVGVRYLHRAKVDFSGDAVFTPVSTGLVLAPDNPLGLPANTPVDALVASQFSDGALRNQSIGTTLTLPSQLVVGVALRPTSTLRVLADYQWMGWSSFDRADIAFDASGDTTPLVLDYQNTSTYRVGAELNPVPPLYFRAGYIYNTAAEKDYSVSPLLPEAERDYYSAGLGFDFGGGLYADLAYQSVQQADRRGRVRDREPGLSDAELRALNVGVYAARAHILSATLSYRFRWH